MEGVDGSCMVRQDNLIRVCYTVLEDNKCKSTRGAVNGAHISEPSLALM